MRQVVVCWVLLWNLTLVGCDDEPSSPPDGGLPDGTWGQVVKVLDRRGETIGQWSSELEPPTLELGGFVLAKVVVGSVTLESSDQTILQLESIEERDVGQSGGETDYDTWFTMRAMAEGEAELIITADAGAVRRFPVHVAAPVSVALAYRPWLADDAIVIPEDRFGDTAVLREPGSVGVIAAMFELRLSDAEGKEILTHLVWTLEAPGPAEFIELIGPPKMTSDSFWNVEPERHEGKTPFVWPVKPGTTSLRVETSAGLTVRTPLQIDVGQGPYQGLGENYETVP